MQKNLPIKPSNYLRFAPALSLTELLIGMAILAIVGLMVAGVYMSHFRLFSNQSTNIDVASQNRVALDEMANQIREASGVITNYTGLSVVGCTVNSDPDSVVITLWPLNATGEPKPPSDTSVVTTFDRVVYCVDTSIPSNKKLIKTIVLSSDGSSRRASISTAPQDAAYIKIRLKISAPNFNRSQTFDSDIEAQAVLRNK